MSRGMEYLETALSGWKNFISEYKYLALIMGVLFYAVIRRRSAEENDTGRFLRYAVAVTVLLIIPVTAAMGLIYQTRFYDYEWVWSFVPLTAVLAWGIVTILFEEIRPVTKRMGTKDAEKKLCYTRWLGILAAAAVLFVCGNQGQVVKISQEERKDCESGIQILQYLEEKEMLKDHAIWGPAGILQYMRTHNGDVCLLYGRDMWDKKAGAYDYEAYAAEEIACYEWMELVSDDHSLYLLEIDQATERIHEALAEEAHIREALKLGADVMILPEQLNSWIERKLKLVAAEEGLQLWSVSVGEYTIWLLDE